MSKASRAVEDALRAGDVTALRKVTDAVDAEVVADAVLALWGARPTPSMWRVARSCQQLPPRAVEAVLRRLRDVPQRGYAVFVLEGARVTSWRDTLRGYLDLSTQHAWGSKESRERVKRHAVGPLLPAIQAATVAGGEVPLKFHAVLASDASDASLDALLASFSAAAEQQSDRLARLRKLKTHAAATDEMHGFFEAVERGIDRRAASSGVMAFAQSLGLDGKGLKVRVTLRSTVKQNVPMYQGSVAIDATSARWFHVSLSRVSFAGSTSTHFTTDSASDALNVGRCEPHDLPAWLAKTQDTLRIRWATPSFYGSLRGKKRQAFIDWLFGPSRA